MKIENVKLSEGHLLMNKILILEEEALRGARTNQQQHKVFSILSSFNDESVDLIKFIHVLEKNQLDLFRDYVNDYDDCGVNSQTILDLASVWEFI